MEPASSNAPIFGADQLSDMAETKSNSSCELGNYTKYAPLYAQGGGGIHLHSFPPAVTAKYKWIRIQRQDNRKMALVAHDGRSVVDKMCPKHPARRQEHM